MYFDSNFTEILYHWQQVIIGSDSGLTPNRWQVIMGMSNGIVYWRIYASGGLVELWLGDALIYASATPVWSALTL